MSELVLITPPDKFVNNNYSILFVCPSEQLQAQANEFFVNQDLSYNVYIYSGIQPDADWLITTASMVDLVIVDRDSCDDLARVWFSYLIAKPNTYWLTSHDTYGFHHVSQKRIYDFSPIEEKLKQRISG